MRVPLPAICVWVCLLASTGCFTPPVWIYTPAPRQEREPETASSVVVPPLIDERPDESTSAGLWYLMPLMPFGWETFSRPEDRHFRVIGLPPPGQQAAPWTWEFDPRADLAQALADELDAARVFRAARVGPASASDDFALVGRIRTLDFHGKALSYCVGPYALLLWPLGFPFSTTRNSIELDLTLTATSTREVLWRHTIRAGDSRVHWIYTSRIPDFRYPELLKAQMPAMIDSLREAVRKLQ